MSRGPCVFVQLVLALAMVITGVGETRLLVAQPLLREAPETEAERHDDLPHADGVPRRGRITAEEQHQRDWERMMEFNRDQILKEAVKTAAGERMMRYALWIAIGVIALTLLVAFARNRADAPTGPTLGAEQGRGAPPATPASQPANDEGDLNRNGFSL